MTMSVQYSNALQCAADEKLSYRRDSARPRDYAFKTIQSSILLGYGMKVHCRPTTFYY